MKNILCLALLSVVIAIPFVKASAQEERVAVTVPFAFHVNNSTLPAGTYIIATQPAHRLITFASTDAKVNALTQGMSDPWGKFQPNVLVFHRYGNQYFLHRLVRADSTDALYFVPTKAEKRVRRETEIAGVAAGDPVVIALNTGDAPVTALEAQR
jgi:hypothetical protein